MSGAKRSAAFLVCAAAAGAAFGGEPGDEPVGPEFSGEVSVGWRFVDGEGEGRYLQDDGRRDGPRLFHLDLYGDDVRPSAILDAAELHLAGIGDANSDATASLRRSGLLRLDAGYRRDDQDYRATGDPFAYDTIRERSYVRGVLTPGREFTIRFGWDRNDREGDGFTRGNDFITGDSNAFHRTLSFGSDRFSLGAEWARGIFRAAIGESIGVAHTDDSRFYDAPRADPARETTRVLVRTKTYTTTARAGVVLPDDAFTAMLFLTHTDAPLVSEPSGFMIDSNGTRTDLGGSGELRRDADDLRFETSWRPCSRVELSASAGREDVVDEESGTFLVGSFKQSSPFARITDRARRYSADVAWQATDAIRLRIGEEYLREELFVPTDSHFSVANDFKVKRPTDTAMSSWRTTAGADWTASRKVTIGALARISTNSDPLTTAIADRGDDASLRVRYDSRGGAAAPGEDRFTLTSVVRRKTLSHGGDVYLYDLGHFPDAAQGERAGETTGLDSATRATSVTESAAYTDGRFTARGTATWRSFSTTTDTAYGTGDNPFITLDSASFSSRDVTTSLDLRYELIRNKLRVFGRGSRTETHGDTTARWLELSGGVEHDLVVKDGAPVLTLGLTLSTWRLADKEASHDDYSVHAAEIALTYHF